MGFLNSKKTLFPNATSSILFQENRGTDLTSDAAFQFNFIHNATFIMINQLLHSYQKQRHRKKADQRANYSSKMQQKSQALVFLCQEQQQSPLQSPMPIKLIHLSPQDPYSAHQQDYQDIQQNIGRRLKPKNAYLPKIYQNQHRFKSLSPQARSYQVPRNNLAKSSINKQLRTESSGQRQEQDQQDRIYQSTIIEISQLNNKFKKNNQRRGERSHLKYSPVFRIEELGRDQQEAAKFDHPSRQQEFQQYTNYLQNSYHQKLFRKKGFKDIEIQEKLKNRVQTRKYTYSKPVNPEVSSNEQPNFKQRRQKSKQKILKKSNTLSSSTYNPKKQNNSSLQESNISHQQVEKTQQQELKDSTKMSKLSKQRNIHDDFIKILRKVKNRGESLLIKLNKYPSRQLVTK